MKGKYLIKGIKVLGFICIFFILLNSIFNGVVKYGLGPFESTEKIFAIYIAIIFDFLFYFLRVSFYLGFAYLLEFLLEKEDEKN